MVKSENDWYILEESGLEWNTRLSYSKENYYHP